MMASLTIIIIDIVLGLILVGIVSIGVWRYLKKRKAKKQREGKIPQETLDDFETIERRYKEANGNTTPYETLWQYARERSERRDRATTAFSGQAEDARAGRRTEPVQAADEDIRRDREPIERRSVQVQSDIDNPKNKRKPKLNWEDFS
jgi:hypothetical protein